MCAFIDELVDVFADDVESRANVCKNLHPYLPRSSSEVKDAAPPGKLSENETELHEGAVVAVSAGTVPSQTKQQAYRPSASGKHHQYLPPPKASKQFAKESIQDNFEGASKIALADDDEKPLTVTVDEVKPFRRHHDSLHPYLRNKPNTSKQAPLDSAAIADEKVIAHVAPRDFDVYANPKLVLEANPELHDFMFSFLGIDMKGGSWPQRDFETGIEFLVPVR
jgi:hypothetical protein